MVKLEQAAASMIRLPRPFTNGDYNVELDITNDLCSLAGKRVHPSGVRARADGDNG